MNWLLITSNDQKEKLSSVVNFLENNKVIKYEHFISTEGKEKTTFSLVLPDILCSIQYCILILDKSLLQTDDITYTIGYLRGSNLPTFAICLDEDSLSYCKFMLPKANYFISINKLTSYLADTFYIYVAEEMKKKAHKKLFEAGIPFTPDCFSFHIIQEHITECNLFIEAGMDVNCRDSAGTPMLCIAARAGNPNMIEWLVKNGADINVVSKDRGYSPVMDAVWKSNIAIVELLVKLGANLNFIGNDGQSALVLATGASNIRICEILVKNGANPTVKDKMGMSALDYAKLFKKTSLIPLYEEYVK